MIKVSITTVLMLFLFAATPVSASKFPGPEIGGHVIELYKFPGWFKPICGFGNGPYLLLFKFVNGKVVFNPGVEGRHAYRHIIDLRSLTVKRAHEIWGAGRKNADGLTFDLISMYESPESNVYHLDIKTSGDNVTALRLRGIDINTPEWFATR